MIERLNADSSKVNEMPLVQSIQHVVNSSFAKLQLLAEDYYKNYELTRFSAIFLLLDKETQEDYCLRMIQDRKSSFLSSVLKYMDTDLINFCADETYEENNIALFSVIDPYMSEAEKQIWIAESSRDHRNTFLSVLTR